MTHFFIENEDLLDFVLTLQRINDIALPIAVQNSLNAVARDTKKRTLKISTGQEFDVKKPGFFKANSGYLTHGAREFKYDINKLKAEVGITKGLKQKEKATEQIGHQETASPIKRSINPLGKRPIKSNIIDLLSKKPVVYDSNEDYGEPRNVVWMRRAGKAYRNRTGFLTRKGNRGAVNMVKSITRKTPTRGDTRTVVIKTKTIASYEKSGTVKLKTRKPFLSKAVEMAAKDVLERAFVREVKKQIDRAKKK